MISTAYSIPFEDFCILLESISKASAGAAKQHLLTQFVNDYIEKGNNLARNDPNIDKSFYPILRLLLPQLERERKAYNLQEYSFAKTLVNILHLHPKEESAVLLYNYKQSTDRNIKDFSQAAVRVLRRKFVNNSCNLSVGDVNDHLDIIAENAGKDIRGQETAVSNLLKALTSTGQKWAVRIILKSLKIHMGTNSILSAFHKDALRLFACNSSLAQICNVLCDPNANLNEIEIELFTAFRPMLSKRCNNKEFKEVVKNGRKFFIENKFDGERFQVHYDNGKFKYISRNGFDYTSTFGGDSKIAFSLSLHSCFVRNIKNVIFDGEMMVWNIGREVFATKGMDIDVKTMKPDGKYRPCFCIFDILYLNDEVLSGKPLQERKELLSSHVKALKGSVLISEYSEASSKQDILNALNLSVDKKEEGIIFKDPNSPYLPNSRENWWKMKLEYFEGVMADLDVIVMGGYYSQGKKDIVEFLVGIVEKIYNKTRYLSFAKISNGLNASERKLLRQKLGDNWHDVNGNEHERYNLFWGKEVPDIWIKPEHSCCVMVRGSELVKIPPNSNYRSTHTLRFPRILKLRFDKPYSDCLSSAELNSLTESSGMIAKLSKRHLEISDFEEVIKKRRKNKSFQKVSIEKKSDLLTGYEFHVLSGRSNWSVDEIETEIRENGGKVVKLEGESTLCMLVGDDHIRTKTYKGEVDIVKLSWLVEILNEGDFELYEPRHLVYTSPKTKIKLMKRYDKYGDSYTTPAIRTDIKYILNSTFTSDFEKDNYLNITPSEMSRMEDLLGVKNPKCFYGYTAYFDKYKVINDLTTQKLQYNILEEIDFISLGGESCEYITQDTDFVIIGDPERIEEMQQYTKDLRNKVQIFNSIEQVKCII